MKGFVEDPDFLLGTGTAVELYHGWAERMPIVDYHCHIDPKDIWEDRHFEDLSQVWLRGDHYKWRLMRSNGVPEELSPESERDGKNSRSLPRCCPEPLETRCTTGVTWN